METPDGEIILPAFPLMYTTTVGAGEVSAGAGTTHGFGMPVGDGTPAGAGVGTILGDLTVGAGAGTLAGATHTTVGAGPATLVGADTMAGEAITATIGAIRITTEDIMVEIMPTCPDEEVMHPVYPVPH